jgi:5-methylcytosine-specific restriction endonuclease McrA
MHWKRARAAEIGYKPQAFDGARMRRYYERKNWLRNGDDVTIDGLRERDGDQCGICGDSIDFSLNGRNAMGRTVDHILPRSRGGAHTWANTQLAHLRCNLQKGAKVA